MCGIAAVLTGGISGSWSRGAEGKLVWPLGHSALLAVSG